ncbi:MAG TPA: efflux RND transporter periplasmic adaptor subunit [Candidatus Methylomirabilis sp.]|nr:efflux RND transporter periplasmic adaptor subunit [Candidatus Methylomirabilis sp.]
MKKAMYSILLFLAMAGLFLVGSWYGQQGAVRAATHGTREIVNPMDPMHPGRSYETPATALASDMPVEPVHVHGGGGPSGGRSASMSPGAVTIHPEQQHLIGLRVSAVEKAAATHTLRIFARVAPDETKTYRVNAAVDGWIGQVSAVTTGSRVEKDQLLATVSTQDLVVSAQQYILALTAMDRLTQSGQESPAQSNPTNSNFRQRIERLQSLGMSASQIEEIRQSREIPQSIKILAPAAGFVLARNVSDGQKFEKGAEWYRIADLSRVWILADVLMKEAKHLRPGAVARVTVPDDPAVVLHARVSDILPQFDATARRLKVRLVADNSGYLLRPDMFVDVELPVSLPPAVVVPVDAVLDSGLKKTVFVDRGEGVFEPRQVETGWRIGDRVEVVKGVTPGERIVVSGTFLLDSESRMKGPTAGTNGTSNEVMAVPTGHEHGPHRHGGHQP